MKSLLIAVTFFSMTPFARAEIDMSSCRTYRTGKYIKVNVKADPIEVDDPAECPQIVDVQNSEEIGVYFDVIKTGPTPACVYQYGPRLSAGPAGNVFYCDLKESK